MEKMCADNTNEERIKRIERKLDYLFNIIEGIRYEMQEKNWNKKIYEAKKEKENAENLLKEFEMCKMSRYERMEQDRKEYQGYGECQCEGRY